METQLNEKIAIRTAQVAIIGLGYVGLPLAVAFAKAGFTTVGIEINQDRAGHPQHRAVPLCTIRAAHSDDQL